MEKATSVELQNKLLSEKLEEQSVALSQMKRELEIEASLEIVRARAMAMKHSEELNELIGTVFTELTRLDLQLTRCTIMIFDPETNDSRWWMVNVEVPSEPMSFLVKYHELPPFQSFLNAWKKRTLKWEYDLCGKDKEEWDAFLFSETELSLLPDFVIAGMKEPKRVLLTGSFNNFGGLNTASLEPLSGEHLNIMLRFAKVFDLTYTRFNDLQKAEALAREAQIEAALERVRSTSMSMHSSEQLSGVIKTVTDELQSLGFSFETANFITNYTDEGFNLWLSVPGVAHPSFIYVPYDDNPFFRFLQEGVALKKQFDTFTGGKEEKDKFFTHFFSKSAAGNITDERKKYVFDKPGIGSTTAFRKHFYFTIVNYEGHLHSPEENNILSRFANVFEQSYTRFLDLQKAEAQAKEAQIEAALEKVRSRSLAMHHSAELKEVITEVLRKLQELGIAMENRSAIICLYKDGAKEFEQWVASPEHSSAIGVQATYFDSEIHNDIWNARINGTDFYAKSYTVEEKNAMFQYFFAHTDLRFIPEKEKNWLLEQEYYELATAFEKHSAVMIANFTVDFLDSGVHQILKRFAKVFEQAYIRFLDLQKAEAQAREAQIEAGLERVRYSAMAMQCSEDVSSATAVVFNEISLLGVEAMRCGITIIHPDKTADVWAATTTSEGKEMKGMGSIDFGAHPLWVGLFEAWKNKEENYSYDLIGDDLKSYYNVLTQSPNYNSSYIQHQEFPDHTFYASFFEQGAVFTFSLQQHNDEKRRILKRFTAVFSLTFRRYLDLKQAEAQARESKIEAALEKVRSRTLAMQKSDELAETAAEVFRQLIALGIEPNRLYIGIIRGETGDMEMWATDEDGTQVGKKFMFNKNENASVKKLYDGWATKQVSVIVNMEGKELEDYFHYLNHVMHIPFKGGLTQTRRVQSVAYFSKGFIGMASPDGQGDETIQLLERFASVFNLTFTRFNDLKIAEAHAEQAELDLIQLKEEKKRTEEALNELRTTQKQLIQSEKMASLGELTAGIAHEIQNPLNFVNNFSEVSTELVDEMNEEIQKGNLEDAQQIASDLKENLTKINHHGKRAGDIVKGMLQHSRSSNGVKEPTDINALADEYLRLAYHGLRAKDKSFNATMITDYDGSVGMIDVIPQDIGRVILNLITNAFYVVDEKKKQTSQEYEPTVSVSTKKSNGKVEISVKDNGNGIPVKVLDKIFQPFFTTKPTGQGTGLGLSLSYDIVKAHGGILEVKTIENEGTEFTVQL